MCFSLSQFVVALIAQNAIEEASEELEEKEQGYSGRGVAHRAQHDLCSIGMSWRAYLGSLRLCFFSLSLVFHKYLHN